MRITQEFHQPDRFIAGTVGEPGQRTFYLQVREQNRLASMLCEKEQVLVLAEHLERILDELGRLVEDPIAVPPPVTTPDDLGPLDQPLEEDFRIGSMSLAWDAGLQAVAIELFSADTDDEGLGAWSGADAELEAGESCSIRLTASQCRQFVARSRAVVESGRPACPFCGQPINPEGHICPRANGYRRPLFES